jgi:hypothetical protein
LLLDCVLESITTKDGAGKLEGNKESHFTKILPLDERKALEKADLARNARLICK